MVVPLMIVGGAWILVLAIKNRAYRKCFFFFFFVLFFKRVWIMPLITGGEESEVSK